MTSPTDFTRWLHAVVNRLVGPGHPDHDDLVSEGLIAMWKADERNEEADPGRRVAYMIKCAETRLKDLAFGHGQPTGHEPNHGSQPVRVVQNLEGLTEDRRERISPTQQDIAEMASLAYHHGEIYRAVGELSDAQRRSAILVMRGHAMTKPEHNQWYKARERLAVRLAHLNREGDTQ